MSTSVSSPPAVNPYVGPRPFDRDERLYGRDLEVAELRDLLIAERIVLLYSPSGAGKTSLIRASLVPELQAAGFRALPEIRVAAELPPGRGTAQRVNRYLASTLLCLEKGVPEERQHDLDDLAGMGLDAYLTQCYGEGDDDVLIFDQFEELLVTDLADQDSKLAFLQELGAALRNRRRWALFAMREDYVAGLDPYLRLLPTHLRITFRLDLLGEVAARTAIQEPARDAGVTFSDAAVLTLVDSLRRVRVRRPGGPEEVLGPYVEPVQLQVVCQRLWERPRPDPFRITAADVEDVGDVDSALADYYDGRVKAVVRAGAEERAIRTWFDRALITEEGMRAQTLAGPLDGGAGDGQVLERLERAHLVRVDTRGGVKWFELAHDRLIDPVRASNAEWRKANLQPFQRQAQLWHEASRPGHLLLTGEGLAEAHRWVDQHPGQLEPLDRDFLTTSQAGDERRAEQQRAEQQRARRWRRVRWLTAAMMAFVLVVLAVATYNVRLALSDALASESAVLLGVDPAAAVSKAVEATRWPSTPTAQAALARSLAESHVRAVLHGHEGSVDSVDVSRDGRVVVTTSADGRARTWDAATGDPVAVFGQQVRAAVFSPDGSRVVTASLDATARLWDAQGRQQAVLDHDGGVTSARWNQDGSRIVTASLDTTARVWDAQGVPGPVLEGHTGGVLSAAWSPDGSSIVTTSVDKTVQVWDAGTGRPLQEPILLDSQVIPRAAVFSPDGSRVVTAVVGADGAAVTYLLDWRTGLPTMTLPGDRPVFDKGGEYVLTVDDRAVSVRSAGDGGSVSVLQGHEDVVTTARFDASGTRVVTGSRDGVTRVWDVATGARLVVLRGHRGTVNAAVFAPPRPDASVVVTAGADGTARVWDTAVGPLLSGYPNWLNSASFSADGRLVVGAGVDGVARVWPSQGGAHVAELRPARQEPPPLSSASFSPDGRYVVTGGNDGMVRVWDWSAGKESAATGLLEPPRDSQGITAVAFDRSGGLVAIAGPDDTVRTWRWDAGEPPRPLGKHGGLVTDVVFSPDGSMIVTASEDETARVWDAAARTLSQTLSGHSGRVSSAAFSPSGEFVVTAGDDRTARVWNVATGREGAVLVRHENALTDAAFSGDGSYIVTGASDGTVGVWEARTGRNLALLELHNDAALSVQFSPVGLLILSASQDSTARVYDCEICVPVSKLRDLAEERLRYVSGRLPAVQP